jgi:hypothetical protein
MPVQIFETNVPEPASLALLEIPSVPISMRHFLAAQIREQGEKEMNHD